jgi:hypothetical protein
MVNEAIMAPLRLVQKATHFRRIQMRVTQEPAGPDGEVPPQTVTMYDQNGTFEAKFCADAKADREWKDGVYWTPCSPGEVALGAEARTWMQIEDASSILEPLISPEMMEQALHRSKSTVGADELARLDEWTVKFGQEA